MNTDKNTYITISKEIKDKLQLYSLLNKQTMKESADKILSDFLKNKITYYGTEERKKCNV